MMDLIPLANDLAAILEDTPSRYHDAGSYERGLARLQERVARAGGRLDDVGTFSACRIHGLRATSTMGPVGAVRNWISQARKKGVSQ